MQLLTSTLILIVLCLSSSASGQEAAKDPASEAKMQLGPFAITPRLQLTNLGVDTNVFNEWEDPKRDFTLTVGPLADLWLRLGPARLSLKAQVDYVYFATYSSERSFNTTDSARLELAPGRVRPWVGVSYLNTRDRYSPELDVRARRSETAFSGGVDFVLSRKTTFVLGLEETRTDFPEDQAAGSVYLREVLNRKTTVGTASLRRALTPLTAVMLSVETVRERFQFSPGRDSNGFRLVPAVEFAATALIDGTAKVGYRKLKMLAPGVPDYSGPVASVDLGYRLLGVTRFAFGVKRDVEYSYDVLQPYYILTAATASVTQAVGGPWSVTARAGTQRLDYRTASLDVILPVGPGGADGKEGRDDDVRFWGGGIGCRLGPDATLRFDVNYYKRRSERYARDYTGVRAGTSVTYGF